MGFGPWAALGLWLVLATVALQGCSPDDKNVPTSTMTTTTTTTFERGGHCATWHGTSCIKCEEGFGLVDGKCFYECSSDMQEFSVVNANGKGMCLDDTTFSNCSDEMPFKWPNTNEPIKSIRLFSAWQASWPEGGRAKAWAHLADFVKSNGVKVLVGTQITCNETDDDGDWQHVLELMQMIGAEHIMGLAVGNELELLYQKEEVKADPACIPRLWKGGYIWNKTVERVRHMDSLGEGFEHIPVTSVFGGMILGMEPFFEQPYAMVASYMANATAEFGRRWVFSLNIYPYFDPGNTLDPGSADTCNGAISRCTCFNDGTQCLTKSMLGAMRERMHSVTNRTNDLLWIGETGWSYPMSSTLSMPMRNCTEFSSRPVYETYYKNFLSWDLQMGDVRGPDHVFYFTMRDSVNFGMEEHFGLIGQCGETKCKLQKASTTTSWINADNLMMAHAPAQALWTVSLWFEELALESDFLSGEQHQVWKSTGHSRALFLLAQLRFE
eukprot:CAMPEP_0115638004 /NCGR_PEP_ID=MMETSP0272-20121206/34498_1 /TAXON_ID=71861 /ORGANISM="Scrippsiella trochoidea, Strain CCMP3099" /LENGTH=495 /DNA_ID=CAMNT_0003075101 /DNA_START=63 /DNA_END=1548 /DNA_ORIENTATION=-